MRSHRSRNLALTASLLLLLGPLAACSGDEDSGAEDRGKASQSGEKPPAEEAAEGGSDDAAQMPEAGEPARVTLQDAGSGDRQVLELDVEEGQSWTSEMVQTQTTGEPGQSVDVPPMRVVLQTEVVSVSDEEIQVEQRYQDFSMEDSSELPASARAEMKKTFDALGKMRGTVTLQPDGRVLDQDVQVPDDAPPAVSVMVDAFANQAGALSSPFPAEEVGEGAVWTAASVLELNGTEIEQTVTYTLESLEGDDYVVTSEVQQNYVIDGSQGGAGASLTAGEGSGSGRSEGSLTSLLPTTMTSSASNHLEMEIGGETREVDTELEIELTTEES